MAKPNSVWRQWFQFASPFIVGVGLGLLFISLMRVALLIGFRDLAGPAGELPRLMLTGIRFDLLALSYLLLPAWLAACLVPGAVERVAKLGLRFYFGALFGFIALLECASWPALREYGSRPEALFLEFLGHPSEVVGMVVNGFLLETLVALAAAGVTGWWAFARVRAATAAPWPAWWSRLAVFPLGGALLFLGARSSLDHRPANLSSAVFSENHFHNEAALNSTYTLLYAVYRMRHETDSQRDYGEMASEKIAELVRRESGIAAGDFVAGAASSSMLHREQPVVERSGRPPNVVVVLLESFGAEYTGRLGGTSLTPNFDRLAAGGLAFDRLFSTGTRTSRGIEAVISGSFPTPARAVLKLGLAQKDFFTAPELFRRAGYSTHFVYGGEANFDEMKSFLAGNGVEHIWDQGVLQKPEHAVGVWGIHDEDLFLEADAIFRKQGETPFFALVLSTSNHSPFDHPSGRIEPDPAFPEASVENAIKYTDHALGRFFEQARTSPYFANTLFLVVADHGTRTFGDQLIPVRKFHIPGVILGPPELVSPGAVRALASQVDLMPTLLAMTGQTWDHPMMGRNLLALSPEQRADPAQGRALLQYETHFGYWENDDMVILRPDLEPVQFRVAATEGQGPVQFALNPVEPEPALVEEALAHSLFPSWQYRERLYHLAPTDSAVRTPSQPVN
jgi:phosphoglycerol transferase MdoB-like AlkP superfamily enzyme